MLAAVGGAYRRLAASIAALSRSPDGRALAAILLISTSLNAVGIDWGLPAQWAADEMSPSVVARAMQAGFSNGWHDLYPPFHFKLIAGVFYPLLSLWPQGIDALRDPDTYVRFYLLMRFVSLAMGAGCVVLVYRIGRVLSDGRSAALAALVFALSAPFVYYAKMANLDVPYTFWFLVSVWWFTRVLTRDTLVDWCMLGATTALAVGTKDQAYGLYVLAPVVLVLWGYRVRRTRHEAFALPRAVVNIRTAAALGAFLLVFFVVVHDVVFNWEGFLNHLQRMREAQGTYRMVDDTIAGHASLASLSLRHLRFWLGLPPLGAVVVGVACALARPRRHALALAVSSFVLSYHVFFVHVALYDYDRF